MGWSGTKQTLRALRCLSLDVHVVSGHCSSTGEAEKHPLDSLETQAQMSTVLSSVLQPQRAVSRPSSCRAVSLPVSTFLLG